MIKKKSSSFDLTPLLDVILILFFLILLRNTGEMVDFRTQLDESEVKRIILESERDEALGSLGDANERLAALSDWDNERTGLLDELGTLNDWKEAAQGAINFITLTIQTNIEPRVINISAEPDTDNDLEIIWADNDNIIINEDQITNELTGMLRDIVISQPSGHPTLIMLNHTGIRRQEFNLINGAINLFIEEESTGHDSNIYYSPYEID